MCATVVVVTDEIELHFQRSLSEVKTKWKSTEEKVCICINIMPTIAFQMQQLIVRLVIICTCIPSTRSLGKMVIGKKE